MTLSVIKWFYCLLHCYLWITVPTEIAPKHCPTIPTPPHAACPALVFQSRLSWSAELPCSSGELPARTSHLQVLIAPSTSPGICHGKGISTCHGETAWLTKGNSAACSHLFLSAAERLSRSYLAKWCSSSLAGSSLVVTELCEQTCWVKGRWFLQHIHSKLTASSAVHMKPKLRFSYDWRVFLSVPINSVLLYNRKIKTICSSHA